MKDRAMNIYIKALKRHTDTGLVKSISWYATKMSADGKHRAEAKGEQFLAPKSADDPSFVQYADIDLSTAETWLLSSLTPDGVKNIEQYLNAVLTQKANTTEATGSPWAPIVEPTTTAGPVLAPMRRTTFPVVQSE